MPISYKNPTSDQVYSEKNENEIDNKYNFNRQLRFQGKSQYNYKL